ncbi:MAG: WGR domain-containing protein [Planctomycetia bacterium]|nr:MAG: WGR domain-containing protein [Planctomycetia bacterium]
MLDLLTIALEAHSEELNHHRRYEVSVGRDLLGDWVVWVHYGRVGQPLRELWFTSPDAEEARALMHDRLRRRLSAPRRIGCAYRLVGLTAGQGLDARTWVPGSLLAGLLS